MNHACMLLCRFLSVHILHLTVVRTSNNAITMWVCLCITWLPCCCCCCCCCCNANTYCLQLLLPICCHLPPLAAAWSYTASSCCSAASWYCCFSICIHVCTTLLLMYSHTHAFDGCMYDCVWVTINGKSMAQVLLPKNQHISSIRVQSVETRVDVQALISTALMVGARVVLDGMSPVQLWLPSRSQLSCHSTFHALKLW